MKVKEADNLKRGDIISCPHGSWRHESTVVKVTKDPRGKRIIYHTWIDSKNQLREDNCKHPSAYLL